MAAQNTLKLRLVDEPKPVKNLAQTTASNSYQLKHTTLLLWQNSKVVTTARITYQLRLCNLVQPQPERLTS
jgi:hypothetical protein